ncbi:MAG: hypothetical protein JXA68_02830 [Ignavibacteriales bacterium]|nr:hypothetical protein [Ignavibacteriales bacterium]
MLKEILKIITFILLIAPIINSAQINPGARQNGLSNSDVALSNDVFSIFNNPAGISQMNWREIGGYYSFAPFGLKELATGYVAYNEHTSIGSFGAGFMIYGFELYKESKFALTYSKDFNKRFFAGVTILYQNVSIENYGNDNTFCFNIGGLAYLSKDLRLGFKYHNITRATYGNEANQIPVVFGSGISYDLIDETSINFSIEKDIDLPLSFRFGVEYSIIKYLDLRVGIQNEPDSYSGGLGINYSILHLDYSIFTHNDLGLTHQIGIIIDFGEDTPRNKRIKEYLKLQ